MQLPERQVKESNKYVEDNCKNFMPGTIIPKLLVGAWKTIKIYNKMKLAVKVWHKLGAPFLRFTTCEATNLDILFADPRGEYKQARQVNWGK